MASLTIEVLTEYLSSFEILFAISSLGRLGVEWNEYISTVGMVDRSTCLRVCACVLVPKSFSLHLVTL